MSQQVYRYCHNKIILWVIPDVVLVLCVTGSVFVPFPIGLGKRELSTRIFAVKPSCIVIWSSYLEELREGIDKVSDSALIFTKR